MSDRFSSRFRAIFTLAALLATIAYGLAVCHPIRYSPTSGPNGGDLKCYRAIVDRVHSGESYYAAAAHELRHRGYATSSVFNWRLPLLACFLGNLPSLIVGRAIVFLMGMAALCFWVNAFQRNRYAPWQIVIGGLSFMSTIIIGVISDVFLMHEFWAGTIICLSLALYANGYSRTSSFVGITALLLRELALPFVVLMLIFAFSEGKRREASIWLIGVAAFFVEFFFHWSKVTTIIAKNDRVLNGGWIVFSGWPFVLNTAQMHPFFILAPEWVMAIIVPLSILGFTRQGSVWESRIAFTVGIYMLAFAIVGFPFNAYWGLLYAFLVPIGLLHAPKALKENWLGVLAKT